MPLVTISFKVDATIKKILKELTKELPDGLTRVIKKLILSYIDKEEGSENITLELKQDLKEYLTEQKFRKQKQLYKRKLFYYYLISNTLKTIYRLSISHLVTSGKINMDIIIKVIDGAEEILNNYPEDIKNDLKTEFDNLKLLKNENILIDRVKILKMITSKNQMKELEEK